MGFIPLSAVELTLEEEAQTQSCQNGNVQSCYDVGLVLTTGKNAENQEKQNLGLEYIRRACTYGHNDACDTLGENYFKNGHYLAARPLYEKACERGVMHACMGLGTIYRDGHDVKQDDVISREYYEKACALGSQNSCISVAIIYRGGFGVPRDRNMSKQFYKKACEAGSEAGCDSFKKMDNQDKGIAEPGLWEKLKSLFN